MLGSNVPTVGGLPIGFKYADKWACDCIQIYVSPSRTWVVPELQDEEILRFNTAWQKSRVKVVVGHIPYLVNLASLNQELRLKSIRRLATEIERANRFGVAYLILHPGSNPDRKDGMRLIVEGLNAVFKDIDESKVMVLLETVAGQGDMIGSRFEELAYILSRVEKRQFMAICLDTCHVFAAGYNIAGYDGYERVLKRFDEIIGLDELRVIHMNDSSAPLGARVDRHACIGEGFLGTQVFHAIVKDNRLAHIPKILEIPERDERSKDNLEFLRRLRHTKGHISEKRKYPDQLVLEGFEDVF
ncbi:MAG: deoxyribonuclease IV [Promethearchaeota archaeon]